MEHECHDCGERFDMHKFIEDEDGNEVAVCPWCESPNWEIAED